MTMDRINNDGDYEPGNVRWATDAQQRANKGLRKRSPEYADGVPTLDDVRRWPAMASLARANAALGISHSRGNALRRKDEYPIPVQPVNGPRVIRTADLIEAMSAI